MSDGRIYNCWAGNPQGTPEDKTLCVESVYENYRSRQCARKRGFGPNGEHCRQHDPEVIAKRREKQDAKLKAENDKWRQELNDKRVGAWFRETNPLTYADALEKAKARKA